MTMSDIKMTPEYSTILFTDVWGDVDEFKTDFADSPFVGSISASTPDNVSILYYLLYGKYGNNPIANQDVEQFKMKLFGIIFCYGPTWEKRLDIQSKLRALTEADILAGSKAIKNIALNPQTSPSTSSLEELTYINQQDSMNWKRSKMEAYSQLWDLLNTDVTVRFLDEFKKCFKIFVKPEKPLVYITEDEED